MHFHLKIAKSDKIAPQKIWYEYNKMLNFMLILNSLKWFVKKCS